MQALLISFLIFLTGAVALVMLYFLGNFQQMQRNRINRTPRVVFIPQIETPQNELITPEEPTNAAVEETAEPVLETTIPVLVQTPPVSPQETPELAQILESETPLQRKERLRNMIIGSEIFD